MDREDQRRLSFSKREWKSMWETTKSLKDVIPSWWKRKGHRFWK